MSAVCTIMGLPVKGQMGLGGHLINALPFRGYNLIYNQWFRDENFCAPAAFVTNDGPDTNSWYNLLKESKERRLFHDCATTTTEIHGTERAAPGHGTNHRHRSISTNVSYRQHRCQRNRGVAAVYPNSQGPIKQPAISTSKAPPQPAATLKFTPISPQQLA